MEAPNFQEIAKYCGHLEVEVSVLIDKPLADYWSAYVRSAIQGWCDLDHNWLKQSNMTVAMRPRLEHGCEFLHHHMLPISQAFQKRNINKVYGLQYEATEVDNAIYTVNTTINGLVQFFRARTLSTGVTAPGLPFLVLFTWEECDIYVGERSFVEDCLGVSLAEAYQQMHAWLDEDPVYDYIKNIISDYKVFWPT